MLVGKKLGPFRVERELGSGAMGTVYLGANEETGRAVAIKFIAPGLLSNEISIERFLRESGLLKRLHHPNIAKYLGSGRLGKTPFYIMEFLEGESLDKILERRVRIPWQDVAAWGIQLCLALQHAHEEGIIHRDLKPSNVMLLEDGVIKLTDFGIAKDTDAATLTGTNATLGTASYMSPEQCRGAKDLTGKADLYSMGILFYELITGRKPFVADSPMDLFLMHVKGTFGRPSTFALDLPIWFDKLICHLMAKSPEDRPLSAAKVATELQAIQAKAAEQTSAGLDRATLRRADRTGDVTRLDDEDRDAARTLLGKKKRRKSATPFYTRNWFTFSAVGLILACALYLGYFVFLKPPSAESLFAQIGPLMRSEKLDVQREAREPIRQFLEYHPGHVQAEQVRAWRDRLELGMCQWYVNRERKGDGDPPSAWDAIEDEKGGRLAEAGKRWKDLVKLKESADSDQRGWGLFAEKSLRDLAQVEVLAKSLETRVRIERDTKAKAEGKTEAERIALDLYRALLADDRKTARRHCDDLKRATAHDESMRSHQLLSLKLTRDLQ